MVGPVRKGGFELLEGIEGCFSCEGDIAALWFISSMDLLNRKD